MSARFLTFVLISLCSALVACSSDDDQKKNPVPVVTSVAPATATAGGPAFTLTVNGSGFMTGSTVHWNGGARSSQLVSATQLTASIQSADIAATGTAQVTVVNPKPGGGTSSAIAFAIQNPAPVATSLSPSSITAGSAAFELSVNGSGFVQGATVQWNGSPRPTTFVSASTVKAAIAAADVATAGMVLVAVTNPAPGGGTSAAVTFAVQNPAPVLTSLTPSTVVAGSEGFSLGVLGTGFVPGAVLQFGGSERPTTVVNSTQVTALIAASNVAINGVVEVRVRNPAPTVGPSNVLQFTVSSPPTPPSAGFPMRITVAPDGSAPNGPSINGGMHMDGDNVIFASKASNLVAGDTNDAYDLFVRDTCASAYPPTQCTQQTRRILMAVDGSQPNGDSGWTATNPEKSLAVSFFAEHIAFVSSASNLVAGDTNGVDDVFLKACVIKVYARVCTPAQVRVSVRSNGSESNLPASQPAVADDGRYVFFVSADPNMVPGDTNGAADVFMRDTCVGVSGCTPSTTRVSLADDGSQANGASGEPAFTGRYLAFSSAASNLVAGDTNGVSDIFLRDTCIGATGCTPSTVRISVGNAGEQANGLSFGPQVTLPMSSWEGYDMHGRFVAFVSSASNLVAGDTNGATDVFQRDTCRNLPGCTPSTVRVSVTSTGAQINGASWSPDFMRWDGEVLPFVTAADGVVPEDTNGVADVFVHYPCPFGLPGDCRKSTEIASLGTGGVLGNGASYAPRLNHDLWGVYLVTFVSEATNLVPGPVPTPYYGSIFMSLW